MPDTLNVHQQQLDAVDTARLTTLVRKVLGSPTVTLTNWSYQPVKGGVGAGMFDTFLYRFSGEADDQGVQVSWSLILKVLHSRKDEQPADPKYWKREAELYRSGLLDDLPGDFSAPRCFDVEEFPEGFCWIWMEDIHDAIGAHWPTQHYRAVARHVGQFNGAYLVNRPLPSQPWLSSDWFRKTASDYVSHLPKVLNALNSPLLKGVFPSDAADQYARLFSERDLFLNTLDRLPQTLCHMDVFRRNLMAQRSDDNHYKTTAVDWALTGVAAFGADIAVPILIGLMMCEIDLHDTTAVDGILFEGYLEGLGDAGWQGAPEQVRLGYTTSVVAKYFEVATVVPFIIDDTTIEFAEQTMARSIQDIRSQFAEMFRLVFRMADEAQELMNKVS